MKLPENLKRIRKENNLSQEQLAEKLGVSRQAVSKWESGQSYPEMDKVLLICKLFNYNIDELMNENVKEVNENKQSKININKYIDDFFSFVTKTVDMFSCMKLKHKIKCILEQFVIGFILIMIFLIIGGFGSTIILKIFGKLHYDIYYLIRNILESIYLIIVLVFGAAIMLHIFKIRYLDYFEIIKEEKTEDDVQINNDNNIEMIGENNKTKKVYLDKMKEKIIIRDPAHSQSNFITGIVKLVLLGIKILAGYFALFFILSFVIFIILLVLSFLFVKTGFMFLGAFLSLIAAIVINFIVLELFYDFIFNKIVSKRRTALLFIISLVIVGIGIGLMLIGIKDFNYTDELDSSLISKDIYEIDMRKELSINSIYGDLNYVEVDSNKVRIEVEHFKYSKVVYYDEKGEINIHTTNGDSNKMEIIRQFIKDINNKQIVDYGYTGRITVYASKENIEILKENAKEKVSLEKKINELENNVQDLNSSIKRKDDTIIELMNELNAYKNVNTYEY